MFPVRSRWMFVSLVGALACFLVDAPTQAETYRWITSDGAVHYGDAMPSAQAERGYEIIDPATGTVIQRIDRAKTPQELAAIEAKKKAVAEAAATAAKKEAAQAQHDKMLLALYGNSADIKRARDHRLADIDKEIQQVKDQLARNEQRGRTGATTDVVAAMRESLPLRRHLADLEDRREAVLRQFEADWKRFEQIKPGK